MACIFTCDNCQFRIPIYHLLSFLPPLNLSCTPKICKPYTCLYIGGKKLRKLSQCTLSFKIQWEPCAISVIIRLRVQPHKRHRVVSLSKAHLLPTVLVKPRKRWLRPDMTEKLLTGTLSLNTNKQTIHCSRSVNGM